MTIGRQRIRNAALLHQRRTKCNRSATRLYPPAVQTGQRLARRDHDSLQQFPIPAVLAVAKVIAGKADVAQGPQRIGHFGQHPLGRDRATDKRLGELDGALVPRVALVDERQIVVRSQIRRSLAYWLPVKIVIVVDRQIGWKPLGLARDRLQSLVQRRKLFQRLRLFGRGRHSTVTLVPSGKPTAPSRTTRPFSMCPGIVIAILLLRSIVHPILYHPTSNPPPANPPSPFRPPPSPLLRCLLHEPNLLLRQPVQLIHQSINLPIRSVDLALDYRPLVVGFYLM